MGFASLVFEALRHPFGLISTDPGNPFREFGVVDFRDGEHFDSSIGLQQTDIQLPSINIFLHQGGLVISFENIPDLSL